MVVTLVTILPPVPNIYHYRVTTLVVHLEFLMSLRIFDKKFEKLISGLTGDWSKMIIEKPEVKIS
jgi:hypothetical protein